MTPIRILAAAAVIAGYGLSTTALAQQPKLIQEGQPGSIVQIGGDNLIVATSKADCPAWAVVGDGVCFADVMVSMQQSGEESLHAIATGLPAEGLTAERLVATGFIYEVKKMGEQFAVNKFAAFDLMVPQRCGRLNGQQVRFAIDTTGPLHTLKSSALVICDGGTPTTPGASMAPTQTLPYSAPSPGYKVALGEAVRPFSRTPLAGPALAIYEFYGDEALVVFKQGCNPEDLLFDGACFSSVKAHMRQNGYTDVNVIMTDGSYRVGSQLSFSREADVVKVLSGDYVTWKARHAVRFDNGVRTASGCQSYGSDPNKSGVIIVRSNVAQYYERMACPPLR